ncbi:hypothetical protein FOZ62_016613 [Perkinsus olseni]|uniref:Uncharacterized protein n=2 Tax=Perkinsus olseni TaxID=32597 RepID=A0A7J6TC57_PEROL|nr:hypothetical protein FOZ62_016613 [Perkinsus olseni]
MAVWKVGACAPTRRASLVARSRRGGGQKPICTTTCAAAEVVGSLPLFEHEDAYQWAIFGHGRMVKVWTLSRYQASVRSIRVSFPGSTAPLSTTSTPRTATSAKTSAFLRAAGAQSNIITSLACVERAPYNREKLVAGSGDGVIYFTEGHLCLRSVELETGGDPDAMAVVYLKVLRKRVVALQENGWCTILGDQHQTKSRRVAPPGERLIGASLWRHSLALQTAENPYAGVLDTRFDLLKQDINNPRQLLASAPSTSCTCVAAASGPILVVGCSDGGSLYIYRRSYSARTPLTLASTLTAAKLLHGASGIDSTLCVTCIDAMKVESEDARPLVRVAVGYSNGYFVIFDMINDSRELSAEDITIQYARGLSKSSPLTACHLSPLGGHCAVGCQDGLGYLLTFKGAAPPSDDVSVAESLVADKQTLHGHMCPIDNIMFVVTSPEAPPEQPHAEERQAIHEMVHGTPVMPTGTGRRLLNPRMLAQQAEEARAELPALCLLTCSSRDNQVLCFDPSTHSRIPQTLKVLELGRAMSMPCNRWRLPSKASQVCAELNVLAGFKGGRPSSAPGSTIHSVGSTGYRQVRASPDGRLLCLCDRGAGIVEVAVACSGERIAHRKTHGSASPSGIAWIDNGTVAAVAIDGTVSLWRVPGSAPEDQSPVPSSPGKVAKGVPEITEAELREILACNGGTADGDLDAPPEIEDKENQAPSPDAEVMPEEASDGEAELPSTQHYQWEAEVDPDKDYGCYTWESPQRGVERKAVFEARRARRVTIAGKVGENQRGPSQFPWKEEGFVAGTPSSRFNPSATTTGVSELLSADCDLDDRFRRHFAATAPAKTKLSRGSLVKVKTSVEPGAYVIRISGPSCAEQRIRRVIADLGAQIIRIESPVDSNSVKVPIGFDLSARLKIDVRGFQQHGSIKLMVPRRRAGTVCGYGDKLLIDTAELPATKPIT